MSPNDASGSSEIITASWDALITQIEAGIEVLGDSRQRDVDERGVETG
jgi:hypothetical protein